MGGLSFLTALVFIAIDSFFVIVYQNAKNEGSWKKFTEAEREWVIAIIVVSFGISVWKILSTALWCKVAGKLQKEKASKTYVSYVRQENLMAV